jgi:hypothetical protein
MIGGGQTHYVSISASSIFDTGGAIKAFARCGGFLLTRSSQFA